MINERASVRLLVAGGQGNQQTAQGSCTCPSARPSGRARCGAAAGCSAMPYQFLSRQGFEGQGLMINGRVKPPFGGGHELLEP